MEEHHFWRPPPAGVNNHSKINNIHIVFASQSEIWYCLVSLVIPQVSRASFDALAFGVVLYPANVTEEHLFWRPPPAVVNYHSKSNTVYTLYLPRRAKIFGTYGFLGCSAVLSHFFDALVFGVASPRNCSRALSHDNQSQI